MFLQLYGVFIAQAFGNDPMINIAILLILLTIIPSSKAIQSTFSCHPHFVAGAK
jgi:hypothetical protein